LLHPFMPFLTEELWAVRDGSGILALTTWPNLNGALSASQTGMEVVIEAIEGLRSLRADLNLPWKEKVEIALDEFSQQNAATLTANTGSIVRMSATTIVSKSELRATANVITLPIADGVLNVALPEELDLAAEIARLKKEKHRIYEDIAKIDAKLANADFLKRAPEEVVEEQRERRAEAEARLRKIEEALARLKAA
jgi:valyl-tRNA synthetase